jgi:hypothetical protein
MSRVVVTVFATDTRLDLAVPDEVPVERLLPEIVDVFAAGDEAAWTLAPMGGAALPGDRSLSECGVPSGAVLLLTEHRRGRAEPPRPAPARRRTALAGAPPGPAPPGPAPHITCHD